MPNGKSLYSTFAAAGKAEGVEQAAGINVQALKDTIRSETEKLEWQQQKRDESIDLFSTALDTTSTLYEGHLAKQEFGTYQKGLQQKFAKEKFGKEYTPEQLETLSPAKLTGKGTKWDEASWGERQISKYTGGTQWRFGEGEGSYKMGKSDIMFAGEASKHGLKTDLSMYKEAGGSGAKETSLQKRLRVDRAAIQSGEDWTDMEYKARKQSEGKFYGEKRGFDLGDVVGEKSIFAAGKQKLSSILASKNKPPQSPQVGAGTILKPETPQIPLGGEKEEADILGDEQIKELFDIQAPELGYQKAQETIQEKGTLMDLFVERWK